MAGVKYCPNCGKPSTVIETRVDKNGGVHRLRTCKQCFGRWETVETAVEGSNLWTLSKYVIKTKGDTNDGKIQETH